MAKNLLDTCHSQPTAFPSKGWMLMAIALAVGAMVASPLQAQTFKLMHTFTGGTDGANPAAGFVMNPAKTMMYGTTNGGGTNGAGVVYKLSLTGKLTPLYTFTGGADGGNPQSSLIFKGSFLYGTATSGGANGQGAVYRVETTGKQTVLYSFQGGTDGSDPQGRLAMDAAGNLYGTTYSGGAFGNGTVFEITTKGKEIILHSFGTGEGACPVAGVTLDSAGNVYGTTSAGGAYGYGTVFEVAKTESGWTESTLHDFELTTDGGVPYAGLVFDASGNMWGATTDGGDGGSNGGGTVFELSPVVGGWSFNTIAVVPGSGISGTFRDVLFDASGNLYATTHCDGNGAGSVYELANGTWSYSVLYNFTGGNDGLYSFSNLVMDAKGNLYGTTRYAGANGDGTAFKVTP